VAAVVAASSVTYWWRHRRQATGAVKCTLQRNTRDNYSKSNCPNDICWTMYENPYIRRGM